MGIEGRGATKGPRDVCVCVCVCVRARALWDPPKCVDSFFCTLGVPVPKVRLRDAHLLHCTQDLHMAFRPDAVPTLLPVSGGAPLWKDLWALAPIWASKTALPRLCGACRPFWFPQNR